MPKQSTFEALEQNAQTLANMADGGDDLTKARLVDFSHVLPSLEAANGFGRWAADRGYSCAIDELSGPSYDVTVTCSMVPELKALTEVEQSLAGAAACFGGHADGWGCFAIPKLQS